VRKGRVVVGVLVALAVVMVGVVVWRALPGEGEPLLDAGEAQALTVTDVQVDDGGIAPLRLGREVADVSDDGWLTYAQDDGCTRIEPPPSGAGPVSARVTDAVFHGVVMPTASAPPSVQLTGWAVDGEVVAAQAALVSAEADAETGDGVGLGVPWSNVEDLGESLTLTVSTPSGEAVDVRVVRWEDGGTAFAAADLGSDVVAWLEVADADAPDCDLDEEAWARVTALDVNPWPHSFAATGPVDLGVLGTPVADLGVELEPLEVPGTDATCQFMTPVADPQTSARVQYTVQDGVVIGMVVQDGEVVPGLAIGEPLDAEAAGLTVAPVGSREAADGLLLDGAMPGDVPVNLFASVESADLPELDSRAILGPAVPRSILVGTWDC